MKCSVCGGELKIKTTDLPFKINDTTIVIIKEPSRWRGRK